MSQQKLIKIMARNVTNNRSELAIARAFNPLHRFKPNIDIAHALPQTIHDRLDGGRSELRRWDKSNAHKIQRILNDLCFANREAGFEDGVEPTNAAPIPGDKHVVTPSFHALEVRPVSS